MTYAGASGETATQMADALHFSLPDDTLHAARNRLAIDLASRGQGASSDVQPFQLHDVDSIWSQDGLALASPFLDTLAVNYDAGIYVLDFMHAAETSRSTINDWVADQTNDKIQNLLPEGSISSATKLVLANAIYFSAAWQTPFEASNTHDGTFTTANGAKTVSMMHGGGDGAFGSADGYVAGSLPYDGGGLSMLIIEPTGDFDAFEAGLDATKLAAITTTLHPADLVVTMPKFSMTAAESLKDTLKALGMTDAFSDLADFSGIDGVKDLEIDDVLHKAYIGVDEAGTEAAAATAVVIGPTSVEIPSATLTVDHPFILAIRDNATGAILFLGRVVDPS
jgi:serpin B